MSTSVSNASPPRLLKPVAGNIRNDGAPFVPLSPHKGVRNAAIIYQAIRDLPDKTLIRGDFDKHARPLIYFPERPPKKIGQMTPIANQNARYDRAEFASFMRSIVEATFKTAPAQSPQMKAAFNLRSATLTVTKQQRDFNVGDIRESLRSIATSWNRQNLKYVTSPHRTQPGRESPLQAKRLKQFCDIKGGLVAQLCDALSVGLKGDDARNRALLAFHAMKQLIFSYRILRDKENCSLVDFLQKHSISQDVYTFAKLWLALSGPDRYGRPQFCTESWSLEMDKICPLIIKNYRAQKQVERAESGSERGQATTLADRPPASPTDVPANVPVNPVANLAANALADSPDTIRRYHVLKRRFRHPSGSQSGTRADSPLLAPSVLVRQSSIPQLRSVQVQSSPGRRSSISRTDSVIFKRIDFSSATDGPAPGIAGDTSTQDTH